MALRRKKGFEWDENKGEEYLQGRTREKVRCEKTGNNKASGQVVEKNRLRPDALGTKKENMGCKRKEGVLTKPK